MVTPGPLGSQIQWVGTLSTSKSVQILVSSLTIKKNDTNLYCIFTGYCILFKYNIIINTFCSYNMCKPITKIQWSYYKHIIHCSVFLIYWLAWRRYFRWCLVNWSFCLKSISNWLSSMIHVFFPPAVWSNQVKEGSVIGNPKYSCVSYLLVSWPLEPCTTTSFSKQCHLLKYRTTNIMGRQ